MINLCLIRMWFAVKENRCILYPAVHILWGRSQTHSAFHRIFYMFTKCFIFDQKEILKDSKYRFFRFLHFQMMELIEKWWPPHKAAQPFNTVCRRPAPWPLPSSADPFPFFYLLTSIAFTAHLQGGLLHLPSNRKASWISAWWADVLLASVSAFPVCLLVPGLVSNYLVLICCFDPFSDLKEDENVIFCLDF